MPTRFNPINAEASARIQGIVQRKMYVSGEALQNHANSAHSGRVDPECFACRDIQMKAKRAEENPHKLNFRAAKGARVKYWENK